MSTNNFFKKFKTSNNRKFRVLHIGNIANNGYLNSKILNQDPSVESYSLSLHYYHIMGCPEWEESTVNFAGINQNNPDWYNIVTYTPPEWYFQGEPSIAIACLYHKISKNGVRYWLYKQMMQIECKRKKYSPLFKIGLLFIKIQNRINRHILSRSKFASIDYWKSHLRIPRKNPKNFIDYYPVKIREMIKIINVIYNNIDTARYLALEHHRLSKVYSYFDIIHCYGTDLKYPYFARVPNYVGYEHGTIRDLPFEETHEGTICRLSYQAAKLTFITNSDNIEAAKKLNLSPIKVIPHPINSLEFHIQHFPKNLHDLFEQISQSDLSIFHPSRQHWDEDYSNIMPSWIKANDVLVNAFAKLIQTNNAKTPLLILVNWGATIEKTKKLIKDLDIEKFTLWIDPLPHPYMIEVMKKCVIIADQFYLGAFGSITAKGLGLGKSVLVYLRPEEILKMFPTMPPVLNAKTSDEVYHCMIRMLDTEERRKIEAESKSWYDENHSHQIILNKLEEGYEIALKSTHKRL